MHTRMDAAGAVDAQNAPTAPWKTAQNAVSHSAHTHPRCQEKEKARTKPSTRFAHEIPDSPRSNSPGVTSVEESVSRLFDSKTLRLQDSFDS